MAPKRARKSPRKSQTVVEESDTSRQTTVDPDQGYGLPSDLQAGVEEQSDPSAVRILIATDNHVGYMEKDPVRGLDSINTFREILQIARDRDVDFILLGGDLFHENRPTRTTLHQVMGALREFTLGDRPVSIELLSDPKEGQPEGYGFPAVNYEDPNLNVAIPVFSIHGNHDDPQGIGAEGALSAVDLLSVSGLLNYFGKVELPTADDAARRAANEAPAQGGLSDTGIRIRPVLLRKGNTKIALYGMGNVKDERMHFELRSNRVRMYRPKEDPDEWFNILTIHQNRAAHNPKAVVPESMFDDSVHLVIWGHEHEQLIKPQAVAGKRYSICQPGSSVATSLCPGEAVEKQVAILHVKGRDYHMEQITLKTVRPFIMEEIDLDDVTDEAGVRIDDKAGVSKLLKDRIKILIDQANREWTEKYASMAAKDRPKKLLPLVRLRVLYTRHEMGNLVRFGQSFLEAVANPRDLLQFAKKKGEAVSRKNAKFNEQFAEPTDEMLPVEKLEKVRMGDLVQTYLSTQHLQILNPLGLERAVMQFVDKDDREAISRFVSKELKSTNAGLAVDNMDESVLLTELERIRTEKNKAADDEREQRREESGDEQREGPEKGRTTGVSSRTRRHGSLDDEFGSDDSMLDDEIFAEPAQTEARTRTASGNAGRAAVRPAASQRASRGTARSATQTTLTFRGASDDEETQPQPAPTLSSRAAALARTAKSGGRGSTAAKAQTKKAAAPPRATGGRAAARKASTRLAQAQAASDEEDEVMDEGEWSE